MKTSVEIKQGIDWNEFGKVLQKIDLTEDDNDSKPKPRTREDVKTGLICGSGTPVPCQACPYYNDEDCRAEVDADALDCIEQLESQVLKWISVEERLPDNGVYVLAAVKFSGVFSSGGYMCDAFYAHKFTITSEFADELACEYCEEKDEYFLEEGWYEVIKNWDDYSSIKIVDKVTHWMPLPEPLKEDET